MIEFETHHESADETRLQDEPPVEEPPNRPKKPPVEEPEAPPEPPPPPAEPPVKEPPNEPEEPPVKEPPPKDPDRVPPQKPPVRALLSEDRVQRATPHPVSTGSRFSFPLLVGGIEGERIDTETKNTISSNMKNER
jgi:hypothetical protein